MKSFDEAFTIYKNAVQAYIDKNKDNFSKNYNWPWSLSGIKRAKLFLKEMHEMKDKTMFGLANIVGNKKYKTGVELISILQDCTLTVHEVTKQKIDSYAEKYAHGSYITSGMGRTGVTVTKHPAETKYHPGPQAKAKKDIFAEIVEGKYTSANSETQNSSISLTCMTKTSV